MEIKKKIILLAVILIFSTFFSCKNKQHEDFQSRIESSNDTSKNSNEQYDYNKLINQILNHSELQIYFHFEEFDKYKILQNKLIKYHQIELDDNKFEITNNIKKNEPYVEITEIQKKDNIFLVFLEIPYEGIKGEFTVSIEKNDYIIESFHLVEQKK